jgi:fibronectin type 3 domain-containing protein
MKTILALLLLATVIATLATPPLPVSTKTGKISLQWNASPTPAVTYRLYQSTNNVTWDKFYSGIVGTTYTVTNVPAGSSNWFSVVAVNVDGIESVPSNVLEKPIEAQPAPATGLISVPIVVSVDSTTNNGASWASFRRYTNNVIAATDEPERKFRSAVFVGTPAELVIPR